MIFFEEYEHLESIHLSEDRLQLPLTSDGERVLQESNGKRQIGFDHPKHKLVP